MNILEKKIKDLILREGRITFKTFMQMALYEPELGYYSSDKIKIGREGDYYTSQHLHPAFGAMLGEQLIEIWEFMGKPKTFYSVEPGAGEGYMCNDILNYLKNKEIYGTLKYIIVEPHPFMKHKQKKLLKSFSDKITWISSLNELKNIKGCILSNELLDAFPVHLVEMEKELKEVYVTINGDNNFIEIKDSLSSNDLKKYMEDFSISLPYGYRTEINLEVKDWLKEVNNILIEGFIITIDYGYPAHEYYCEERNRGTLLCYYQHQFIENPYLNIGNQDITAHVNFSSLKKYGEEIGIKTIGFANQGTYLVSLGIDRIISELYQNSKDYLFEIAKIKRLILPGTIGETHKVIIQYKGEGNPVLKGFLMKNQINKL
ncbi:MAG: SAM-dependent methyltransferase [Nitrospirae bacterium]|jgi:SAM-dependent MidA family methyltransferase|nr:SAM-dependent methyltransferase [Nitrospirota bacterium]